MDKYYANKEDELNGKLTYLYEIDYSLEHEDCLAGSNNYWIDEIKSSGGIVVKDDIEIYIISFLSDRKLSLWRTRLIGCDNSDDEESCSSDETYETSIDDEDDEDADDEEDIVYI